MVTIIHFMLKTLRPTSHHSFNLQKVSFPTRTFIINSSMPAPMTKNNGKNLQTPRRRLIAVIFSSNIKFLKAKLWFAGYMQRMQLDVFNLSAILNLFTAGFITADSIIRCKQWKAAILGCILYDTERLCVEKYAESRGISTLQSIFVSGMLMYFQLIHFARLDPLQGQYSQTNEIIDRSRNFKIPQLLRNQLIYNLTHYSVVVFDFQSFLSYFFLLRLEFLLPH